MSLARWLSFIGILIILTGCQNQTGGSRDSQAASAQVSIENKGSDTMVNLALAWAEQYQKLHTEVSLSVTGGGSGTGIAALINHTVDIANASRQIKSEEKAAA